MTEIASHAGTCKAGKASTLLSTVSEETQNTQLSFKKKKVEEDSLPSIGSSSWQAKCCNSRKGRIKASIS